MIRMGLYQGQEYRGQAWEQLKDGLKRLGHPFLKNPEFSPEKWQFNAKSMEVAGSGFLPAPSIGGEDWRLAIWLVQNGRPESHIVILLPHWPYEEPMIITMGVAEQEAEWLMEIVDQLLTQYGQWVGKS